MASGHTVNSVVNKNHYDIFSPVTSMHDFCTSDRCQVTVSLISKYIFFGVQAADGGSYGRGTAGGGVCPPRINQPSRYRYNCKRIRYILPEKHRWSDPGCSALRSPPRSIYELRREYNPDSSANVVSEEFALLEYEVFLFYNVC